MLAYRSAVYPTAITYLCLWLTSSYYHSTYSPTPFYIDQIAVWTAVARSFVDGYHTRPYGLICTAAICLYILSIVPVQISDLLRQLMQGFIYLHPSPLRYKCFLASKKGVASEKRNVDIHLFWRIVLSGCGGGFSSTPHIHV